MESDYKAIKRTLQVSEGSEGKYLGKDKIGRVATLQAWGSDQVYIQVCISPVLLISAEISVET